MFCIVLYSGSQMHVHYTQTLSMLVSSLAIDLEVFSDLQMVVDIPGHPPPAPTAIMLTSVV